MSLHVQGGNIRLDPITGEYLLHGNGCGEGRFANCFECTENPNKCHYGNKKRTEDGVVLNKRTAN
jgi:hypothetical protein